MIRQIQRKIRLKLNIQDAWEFFSSPCNLKIITPPELNMKITSSPPDSIYSGLIITYKVHPFLSVPLLWVTEITHVQEPYFFVDEQRYGPYRMWHHQHRLTPVDGGVEVEDLVHYIMPFGIVGEILRNLWIQRRLEEIFHFREQMLVQRFGHLLHEPS